jgi:hypothetical protein
MQLANADAQVSIIKACMKSNARVRMCL